MSSDIELGRVVVSIGVDDSELGSGFRDARSQAERYASDIEDAFSDIQPTIDVSGIESSLDSVSNSVRTTTQSAAREASEGGKAIGEGLFGSLKERAGSAVSGITSEVKGLAGSVISTVTGMAGSVAGIMEGMWSAVMGPIGIGAGLLSAGAGLKFFGDLEEGSYTLERQSHLTGAALDDMNGYLRETSKQGRNSATDLQTVAASVSSISKNPDDIKRLTKNVDDLSLVSGGAATDIASMDKSISKLYGLDTSGIEKLNNSTIGLRDSFGRLETDTLGYVVGFSQYAKVLNETAPRTAAFGAVLNKVGLDFNEVGGSLYMGTSTFMRSIDDLYSTHKANPYEKGTESSKGPLTACDIPAHKANPYEKGTESDALASGSLPDEILTKLIPMKRELKGFV